MKPYRLYLNVYNFFALNCCMDKLGIGVYHTGIEINGEEYFYCVHSDVEDESGVSVCDPEMANYTFKCRIFLGEVKMLNYKFQQIIDELSEEFTCGKYNMLSFNCNHFSKELSKRMLQIEIPRWIFRTTDFLSCICCCLPKGFVSGQWALAAIRAEEEKQGEKNEDSPLM